MQVPHVELLDCCKVHNLVIHGFAIKFVHLLAGFYPELYDWKSLNLILPQPEALDSVLTYSYQLPQKVEQSLLLLEYTAGSI